MFFSNQLKFRDWLTQLFWNPQKNAVLSFNISQSAYSNLISSNIWLNLFSLTTFWSLQTNIFDRVSTSINDCLTIILREKISISFCNEKQQLFWHRKRKTSSYMRPWLVNQQHEHLFCKNKTKTSFRAALKLCKLEFDAKSTHIPHQAKVTTDVSYVFISFPDTIEICHFTTTTFLYFTLLSKLFGCWTQNPPQLDIFDIFGGYFAASWPYSLQLGKLCKIFFILLLGCLRDFNRKEWTGFGLLLQWNDLFWNFHITILATAASLR